ncbi:MAG: hypothetical protein PHG48_01445 [Eubacteriales bacterium]|nr:hypothetical protein [Eubacteriales bacterium]
MDKKLFPRTTVGGASVSRMIIGTNWILGYSHTSAAANKSIHSLNDTGDNIYNMLLKFLAKGVDTIMGPFSSGSMKNSAAAEQMEHMLESIKRAEEATGKKIIMVDTPFISVDDNAEARREAEATIKRSREIGSTFCLIHHAAAEQLVNKNKQTLDRLPDYLAMIRDNGLIPGLSAHMPELVVYSDKNGYDVETYIQIYNCMGFLMQIEVESVNRIIWNAKKPVMTIKPMAAGRVTPFIGLNFSWSTIRPCDMVTVGCMTPDEAEEDMEISFANFERRRPDLAGRGSPVATELTK